MGLSVKTLFLTNISVLFLSAATAWYFWRLYRDNSGLLWWSLGTATIGLAYVVFGPFGPSPPAAAAAASATLVVAGCIMIWESMRRFNGRPAATGRMAFLVVVFAATISTALYTGADMRHRVGLLSTAMAACAALSAWEVVRGSKGETLRSRLPMAVVFAAMAVALMGRAVIGWLHPSGPPAETFYDAMGDIVPLANTVGSICLNIGFMIMTTERLSVRFRKHALTDELTELPNRRFFLEQADRLSRRAKKTGAGACILMMDLDHFSGVNERFGHAGGDHALVAFARLLREQVPPPHIVARYGGEEFCSFLTGVEAIEGTRIAEHLRATLAERPVDIRGQAVKLTVSIGVAALHDGDLAGSIRTADEALYQAKARGRNQVVVGERKVAEPRGVKKSMFGLARG